MSDYPIDVTYGEGNKLIAGKITGDPTAPLAADTYHQGMSLKYSATPTATGPGTGNGTCTALSASADVKVGDWSLDFSAALVADLIDPDGVKVGTYNLVDGGATVIEYKGLRFTITDGATAFSAASAFTISVPLGNYGYTASLFEAEAFYNGRDGRILSTAGYGAIITGGEISEGGIVNDSGVVVALTTAVRAALRSKGFEPRRIS